MGRFMDVVWYDLNRTPRKGGRGRGEGQVKKIRGILGEIKRTGEIVENKGNREVDEKSREIKVGQF